MGDAPSVLSTPLNTGQDYLRVCLLKMAFCVFFGCYLGLRLNVAWRPCSVLSCVADICTVQRDMIRDTPAR